MHSMRCCMLKVSKSYWSLPSLLLCLNVSTVTFAAPTYTSPIDFENLSQYNPNDTNIFNAGAPSSNGVVTFTDGYFKQEGSLKIANYSDLYDVPAAKTIVISATTFDLKGEIEIMGEPADLVIIARNVGTSSCSDCSFKNVNRVTLIAADTNVTSLTATTKENKKIKIDNLSAEGATVDLVAYEVDIQGKIDTNFKVYKDSEGAFHTPTEENEGNATLGAGAVNLFVRGLKYDYNTQSLTHVVNYEGSDYYPYQIKSNASIASAYIGVKSYEPIRIAGTLDNTSDGLASNANADTFQATVEKIDVRMLASQSKGGDITITSTGKILSDNDVELNSVGYIYTDATSSSVASVKAKSIKIVSVDSIFNRGQLLADTIELASESLFNDANDNKDGGLIQGTRVDIAVDQSIDNAFGGTIEAVDLMLYSKNGTIRNGSQVPYMYGRSVGSTSTSYNVFKNITDLSELEQVDILDQFAQDPAKTRVKANSLSARIYASNINIEAKNVENINPYFVVNEDQENWSDENWSPTGGMFNPLLMAQVSIVAENNLMIKARESMHNVSAVLGQETADASSGMYIVTPKLINKRYLVHNTIDHSGTDVDSRASVHRRYINEKDEHSFSTGYLTYAPPAYIYAHGMFTVDNADKGYFTNKKSYFTAYGNANFKVDLVKSIGDQLSRVDFVSFIEGHKNYNSTRVWDYRTLQYAVKFIKIHEKDALFAVYGKQSSANNVVIENENATARMIDQALADSEDRTDTLHDFSDTFDSMQDMLNQDNVAADNVNQTFMPWTAEDEAAYRHNGVAPSTRPDDPYWKLAYASRSKDFGDIDEDTQAIFVTDYATDNQVWSDTHNASSVSSRTHSFFKDTRIGEYLQEYFQELKTKAVDLASKVYDWFSNLWTGA